MRQAYIAGKYTGTPEEIRENVLLALQGAKIAISRGYFPIIPHTMGHHVGTTWEDAMVRCRDLIRGLNPERDALFLLPNWKESKGAREERLLAAFLTIPVVELSSL